MEYIRHSLFQPLQCILSRHALGIFIHYLLLGRGKWPADSYSNRGIVLPIQVPWKYSLWQVFWTFFPFCRPFTSATLKFDKPRFLGKSIIGFLVFNFLMYSLLFIQLVATDVIDDPITTVILFSFYFVNVWLKDLLIFFNFFMREREGESLKFDKLFTEEHVYWEIE